ncbi:MAG: asparagine synthetase B family protein, partial [Opitutaceae bacterium]
MDEYIEQLIDLTDPATLRLRNMTVEEARACVLHGSAGAVSEIDGSFALVARDGKRVRMARSLDRPMRYFLAKRREGPALIVSDRIDAIHKYLRGQGLDR